jgi:drug/metabolite transporter (DMT)-like permease
VSAPDEGSGPASLRGEARGLLWGFIGVVAFSLTLPATRAAVAALDPFFVALGRALVAALLAAAVLAMTRSRPPTRAEWRLLLPSALGVVFGFPLFTTWALRDAPASHGAVVLAILPLATAAAGAIVAHERPSRGFWILGALGSAVVIAFALRQGGGALHAADLALLAAVASAALGYAWGARAAATLGGWQAISWSLVACLPVLGLLVPLTMQGAAPAAPLSAWAGFAYVAIVSQYVGFFAWYRGLAEGGIARVGQLQLLQPFLTIAASAALLGERVDIAVPAFAAIVVLLVAIGRGMPVARGPLPAPRFTKPPSAGKAPRGPV